MGILGDWLPEDPQQNAAARQGLLALGGAMMSSRGENFLGTLGQGLLAGGQGYQNGLAQQQQAAMQKIQQERWSLENQETKAKLDEPMQLQTILAGGGPGAIKGPPPSLPRLGAGPAGGSAPVSGAPPPASASAPAGQPDLYQTYLGYGDRLTQAGRPTQAKAYYDLAEKLRPKLKEQRALTVDGKRVMANVFEDGTTQQLDGFAPDLEKLNFQNTGAATMGLDPFTGKPVNTITNMVSPDARLRAAQDERESLRTDKRLRDAQEEKEPKFFVSNGLMGKEFLASLDKPTADQVRALADGRMAFPTGKALQSAYWQKMLSAVSQYDPSFDAVNYGARAKARNDLTAGKTGENIKAINTAIAHIGQLDDQMTALDNTTSPAFNAAMNWKATHLWGAERQEKLAAVSATAEGVAGEMAKVFRSTGMSVHEIDAWRQKFAESITPAQQRGTMQAAMHMLQGRMEAIQDQYRTGMGTTSEPLKILTPEAEKVFTKLKDMKDLPKKQPAGLPAGWSVKEK